MLIRPRSIRYDAKERAGHTKCGMADLPSKDGETAPTLAFTAKVGGEGGIRTHGRVAPTHAFQACRFVHSRTSPQP